MGIRLSKKSRLHISPIFWQLTEIIKYIEMKVVILLQISENSKDLILQDKLEPHLLI